MKAKAGEEAAMRGMLLSSQCVSTLDNVPSYGGILIAQITVWGLTRHSVACPGWLRRAARGAGRSRGGSSFEILAPLAP